MRARTYKAAHRQLADSKRSIVMACAGLAMVLGTTSVGASMFSLGNEPTLIERTGTSVIVDSNGENEVLLDEPTVQILQGQTAAIPHKVPLSLPDNRSQNPLQIGSATAAMLLNQLQHPSQTGQTSGTMPSSATTGASAGNDNTSAADPSGPAGGGDAGTTEPDPDDTTAGGDSGSTEPDPDMKPDGDTIISDDATTQQPASSAPLQGSSSTTGTH